MQILPGHKELVLGMAFSPDGSLLAAAGRDALRLWQFPEGVVRYEFAPISSQHPCLAFSPDGHWLAAADSSRLWVHPTSRPGAGVQLRVGEEAWEGSYPAEALAFSPDGKRLLASGERRHGGNDWPRPASQALCRSWAVGSWEALPPGDFDIPCDGVWRDPWALDPHRLVLATPDYNSVTFWDFSSGGKLFTALSNSTAEPACLRFSAGGKRFAVARGKAVTVCDVARQTTIAVLKNVTPKHVQSVAFSPDGRTLITVSNDTITRLFDVDTGCEKASYAWDVGPLKCVAFAPDGMRAAASGKKGAVVVWDVD